MSASGEIRVIPLPSLGEIVSGDDLVEKLAAALRHHKLTLQANDVLVIKHKVVSKAEGRVVDLDAVRPSRAAAVWARKSGADARAVELALRESQRIVRRKRDVL